MDTRLVVGTHAGLGRPAAASQAKVAAAVERAAVVRPAAHVWAPAGPTPDPDGAPAAGRPGGGSARCGRRTPSARPAPRRRGRPTVTRPPRLSPKTAVEATGGRCRRSSLPVYPRQVRLPAFVSTMAQAHLWRSVRFVAARPREPEGSARDDAATAGAQTEWGGSALTTIRSSPGKAPSTNQVEPEPASCGR